jgi:hypothetical protein
LPLSPFDASTIRFTATRLAAGALRLRVDPGDLLFERSTAGERCSLAVQAIYYTAEGDYEMREDALLVNRARDDLAIDLPVAPRRSADRIRVVVFDRNTRSFGTLTLAVGSGAR